MVEFALVLPIFLLLVFGCVDVGRAIFYQSILNNATRDGARYGLVDQNMTDIENKVEASAGQFGGSITPCAAVIYTATSTVLSAAPPCSNSGSAAPGSYGYVTVTASMPFAPLEALFGTTWNVTLFAQSTMIFSP